MATGGYLIEVYDILSYYASEERASFMNTHRGRALSAALFCAVVLLAGSQAFALPVLQMYVEGATYDTTTKTWVLYSKSPFRIWAIGDVGDVGTIEGVKMSVAYLDGLTPTITLTGTTTGGYGGFTDPSTPTNATYVKTVTDGSAPLLGDGSFLPAHDIYGAGTSWQEFSLGDLTLTDSPIADFGGPTLPLPITNKTGQINAYEVTVSGLSEGETLHFDLYNHYMGKNAVKYVNAPFSHDGENTTPSGGGGVVPEPSALAIWGLGVLGLALYRRHRS